MLTKEEYRQNPCGTSSVPFWKTVGLVVPKGMRIVHEREFCQEMLENYRDEPYFRLRHDLREIAPAVMPNGYYLDEAAVEAFAAHIRACYGSAMTASELQSFTQRAVYCPEWWVAIREKKTGKEFR